METWIFASNLHSSPFQYWQPLPSTNSEFILIHNLFFLSLSPFLIPSLLLTTLLTYRQNQLLPPIKYDHFSQASLLALRVKPLLSISCTTKAADFPPRFLSILAPCHLFSAHHQVILLNTNGFMLCLYFDSPLLPCFIQSQGRHAYSHPCGPAGLTCVIYLVSSPLVLPFAHPAPATFPYPPFFKHIRHDFASMPNYCLNTLFLNPYDLLVHCFRHYSDVTFSMKLSQITLFKVVSAIVSHHLFCFIFPPQLLSSWNKPLSLLIFMKCKPRGK